MALSSVCEGLNRISNHKPISFSGHVTIFLFQIMGMIKGLRYGTWRGVVFTIK